MNLLPAQLLGDLTKVQRRARQAVKPGHNQGVALPHVFETGFKAWAFPVRRTALLLVDLVACLSFSSCTSRLCPTELTRA